MQKYAPLASISDAMTVAAYAGAVVVPYIRYETHFMHLAMCRAITIASGRMSEIITKTY